jgi:programmed cell death 6-interacting protein
MQQQKSFEKLSLHDDGKVPQGSPSSSNARGFGATPGAQLSDSKFAHLLSQAPPSLGSREWEFEDMVLLPGPGK